MKTLDVGFDLDGVGYVFFASVHRHLTNLGFDYPEITDELCDVWDAHNKYWNMTDDLFNKVCDDGVDAGTIFAPGDGLTRPGFFEAMRAVKEMGHRVIIITHRWQGSPGNAEINTYKWLHPHRDVIDEVHFNGDKTIRKTDIFIEDNKHNYDSLVAAGTKAVLINRPWNHEPNDDRIRIDSISEYPMLVALLAEFNDSVL